MAEVRYISGYGYAVKGPDGRWWTYSPGKEPGILPAGIDLDLLEKAYWRTMGIGRMGSVFDNPSPNARLLSGQDCFRLAALANHDYITWTIEAKEVLVWRDLTLGTCYVSGSYYNPDVITITCTKNNEIIFSELLQGLPQGGHMIQVRKIWHGAFDVVLNIENLTETGLYPAVSFSAWAVPEEIYNKKYMGMV